MSRASQRATTVVNAPAERWLAVDLSASDVTFTGEKPAGLWVSGDGDIVAIGDDGTSATFTVATSGPLNISPVTIASTSTTATGIIALW